MIYGYILIMVMMLPTGDIDSRAVDWFEDHMNVWRCHLSINMKIMSHH